jgi:hypothetical protein
MKNWTILAFSNIFFLFVILATLIGCDPDLEKENNSPPVVEDFFGYWESENGESYYLSRTKIVWTKSYPAGAYDLTLAVATENINELTKTDFPRGFIFTSIGGIKTFYLSSNKTRFIDGDDSMIYTKQNNSLSGYITTNPSGGSIAVLIPYLLSASYNGSEEVYFQWKKDGNNVGQATTVNPNTYSVTEEGVYTVTVSATGLKSMTSSKITIYYINPR